MKNSHQIIVLRVRVDFADSIIQIRCTFLRNRVIYFPVQMVCKYISLWQASHFWILRQKGKERQREEEWIRREKEGREKGNDRGGARDWGRVLPGVCCLDEIRYFWILSHEPDSFPRYFLPTSSLLYCHMPLSENSRGKVIKRKLFCWGGWVNQVKVVNCMVMAVNFYRDHSVLYTDYNAVHWKLTE